MVKKIMVLVVIICFAVILIPFNVKPQQQILEENLKRNYQLIVKKLKTLDNGHYKLEDNYIIGNNKEKVDINGTGEFIKISDQKIYGNLINDDVCLSVDYFMNVSYKNKSQCLAIDEPEIAHKKLLNNRDNNLVEDQNNDDANFSSKYYYKGKNPNNYIIFSDQCFRIINIANNNDLKIIYEGPKNNVENNCHDISTNVSGSVGLTTWDKNRDQTGDWQTRSSLREIFEDWETNQEIDTKMTRFKLDMSKVDNAIWYIGNIDTKNDKLDEDIDDERQQQYNGKIGLVNASDYLKINCNLSANNTDETCKENNYLYKEKYNWWTINNEDDEEKTAWIITSDGTLKNVSIPYSKEFNFSGTRPVLYLKSDIKIVGNGSELNPFVLID